MNTILQKRIEEAAQKCATTTDGKIISFAYLAALEMAQWVLQNQWISVEEELPPYDDRLKTTSIDVIVMNEYGKATSAWYDYANKVWHLSYGEIAGDDVIDSKITHWMEIPQLKGDE